MITGVVLPPRPVTAFIFLAHRAQHPLIVDFPSSVANSRSRASTSQRVHEKKPHEKLYEYELGAIRTHEIDVNGDRR